MRILRGALCPKQVLLIFLFLSLSICNCHEYWEDINSPIDKSNWVDPHDMGIKTKEVNTESEKSNFQDTKVLRSAKSNQESVRAEPDVKAKGCSDLKEQLDLVSTSLLLS